MKILESALIILILCAVGAMAQEYHFYTESGQVREAGSPPGAPAEGGDSVLQM